MQIAAQEAFSRHGQINPDGLGFSHGQINPDGFFNHHPKRSQNHNQNLNLVPEPSRGRTDRPSSAPAARSRGGKSKVPVEGSNRDQAIAIESSEDEDDEGDQEKGVKAWRRHSTRRSSESQIIGRMADDLTDAKRYEVGDKITYGFDLIVITCSFSTCRATDVFTLLPFLSFLSFLPFLPLLLYPSLQSMKRRSQMMSSLLLPLTQTLLTLEP